MKCEDIIFNGEGMVIKIVSSKTDKYSEDVVMALTGGLTCLVSMMEKYFHMGEELNHTPKACVFWGIAVIKEGECLRKTGGLSYTRLPQYTLTS